VEVHVVARGYWGAVKGGGLVMPAAKRGFDFFINAVADSLQDFCFDYIALRVDRDFDDHVTHQIFRKLVAVNRRIWKNGGIGDMDFMTGDGPVDQGAEWRAGPRIVIASICILYFLLKSRLRRLGLRPGLYFGRRFCVRENEFCRFDWLVVISGGWKINQPESVGAVSIRKPRWSNFNCGRIVEHEPG